MGKAGADGEAIILFNMAHIHLESGNLEAAEPLIARVVALDEQLNDPSLARDKVLLQQIRLRLNREQEGGN